MRRQCRQIVGIVIHIVSFGRLGRTSVTSTVVCDDTKTAIQEEHHLGVPIVRAQWPAMREDNGRSTSPVLVEDVDTVLGLQSIH